MRGGKNTSRKRRGNVSKTGGIKTDLGRRTGTRTRRMPEKGLEVETDLSARRSIEVKTRTGTERRPEKPTEGRTGQGVAATTAAAAGERRGPGADPGTGRIEKRAVTGEGETKTKRSPKVESPIAVRRPRRGRTARAGGAQLHKNSNKRRSTGGALCTAETSHPRLRRSQAASSRRAATRRPSQRTRRTVLRFWRRTCLSSGLGFRSSRGPSATRPSQPSAAERKSAWRSG
mmetsp:Transcript_35699/g.90842  ORF Transcript_35699/g.90842 Transcript_35699/m.90842 type:complete len:231 (-) Transcript_35699:116-808(-)